MRLTSFICINTNKKGTSQMRTCKECNKSIEHKRKSAQFCGYSCSSVNKARKIYGNDQIVCKVCEKRKPRCSFSYNNKEGKRRNICKKCGRNEKERKKRERTWKTDVKKILISNSRQRAKLAGLEHTLTKDDLVIPDKCPVFGFELKRERKNSWIASPSIDRIDNNRGYTPDNIIIVSRRANILKKDATIEELEMMANFYRNFKK